MTPRSADLYLNSLCLAAYAPGPSTVKIATAVVKMFDDLSKEERTMMSPINVLYVKLLREISVGNLDLSNRAEASSILLKYQDDKAFETNRVSFKELQNLLIPDQLPAPQKIRVLFNRVKNNLAFFKTNSRIRKMLLSAQRVGSEDDVEKQTALFKEILASAEELRSDIEEDPAGDTEEVTQVDEIDFTDPKSMMKALAAQKKKRSDSKIVFGLQGLNRMMGPNGGASYGESMAVAARSHNYKSGMLMDMARWICTLNKPPECNGKTPVVLFVSLENEIAENMMEWLKKLFVNAYHRAPNGLSDEEIIEYVMRAFGKNGFKLICLRRMGETFGYREFVEEVEKIEKCNCKVVASIVDYITLAKRCPEDKAYNEARQIQLLVERFRDYCGHKDMFFVTGLQLETEAARLAASGQTNIVKRYNESHLADCKGSKRSLDILLFLELENNHKGNTYLTIAWNKHRGVVTDTKDKYTAYRFINDDLGILDDINGKDESVNDIYAESESENGEQSVSVF